MIEFFTGWWQYSFMRSAFLAVMIITPLFGILGTMIVNRKMAFFSDALGHSALTGIAVGDRAVGRAELMQIHNGAGQQVRAAGIVDTDLAHHLGCAAKRPTK